MTIVEATQSYEGWLGRHIRLVPADLAEKHRRMAKAPLSFLRATCYRWLQTWPAVCASLTGAPRVLAVGDLHIENFGTWRDSEGRLVWGVNDVDEACTLPYTLDLVRLATSAQLAIDSEHLGLTFREACTAILDGYTASLARGGRPIVLAERNRWLRAIAVRQLDDPQMFWSDLVASPRATVPRARAAIARALPPGATGLRLVRRVAGVGSLGRPRVAGIATVGGSFTAREAKAWALSAAAWLDTRATAGGDGADLLRRAVRVADPCLQIGGGWVIRRLAPDCTKIEIDELGPKDDPRKLLRAMGWEAANLHLGTPGVPIAADLNGRPSGWLRAASADMRDALLADWRVWRTKHRHR